MSVRRLFHYPDYDLGVVTVDDRRIVCGTGEMPPDFPLRLCRLKETSGLSWNGLSEVVGTDAKQLLRWRQGAEPGGGAIYSIVWVAAQFPGGLELVMGQEFRRFLTGP